MAIKRHWSAAIPVIFASFLDTLQQKLKNQVKALDIQAAEWPEVCYEVNWTNYETPPTKTAISAPFEPISRSNQFRCVGFKVMDRLSVELELGWENSSLDRDVNITVGIRRFGNFVKVNNEFQWVDDRKLDQKQERRLMTILDSLVHPTTRILESKAGLFPDWHLCRVLDKRMCRLDDDDSVSKFYSMAHNPSDKTMDDLVDFMVQIGLESSKVLIGPK